MIMGKRKRNTDNRELETSGASGLDVHGDSGDGEPPHKIQNVKDNLTETNTEEEISESAIAETESESIQPEMEQPQLPETKSVPQLRTSVRVQNKKREENKIDIASSENSKKAGEEDDDVKGNEKKEGKKRRRAWEVWSMEDKDGFFEAINECGKDFEGIQAYLSTKLRKKGNTSFAPKNKDQVRHFYYRTWHKICKYVEFSEGVKKSTQELYALVNYGEFRRKVGGTLNEKKGVKLHQLIQKGSASIRVKGKSIRVRTPICRALKKVNDFQDDREQNSSKLPANISVEITPATVESWTHVQGLAHNPRVRIVCSLDRPVSSVISHLKSKWKSQELKLCERLVSSLSMPTEIPSALKYDLRLRPPQNADIQICDIQPDAQMTSSTVSLLKHEELIRSKMENMICLRLDKKKSKCSGRTTEKTTTSSKDEDECYAGDLSQEEGSDCETEECLDKPPLVQVKTEPIESSDATVKEEDAPIDALRQLKALNTVATPIDTNADDDVVYVGENTRLLCQARDQQQKTVEATPATPETEDEEVVPVPEAEPKQKTEEISAMKERLLKGWNSRSCCNYTVGQLYLMLGKNKKLSLEYLFEPMPENETAELDSCCDKSVLESSQDSSSNGLDLEDTSKCKKPDECSEVLSKILNLIEIGSSKSMDCIHCGQLSTKALNCKSPAANRMFGRSPTQSRSPRMSSHINRSPKSSVQSKSSSSMQRRDNLSKPASAKRLIPPTGIEEKKATDGPTVPVPIAPAPAFNVTEVQPDAAVFKVPFTPVPRNVYNTNINQKLMPKYVRQNRRTATHRKHMFVQRELPLLPNIPAQKPGNIITLNVLQQQGPQVSHTNTMIQVPVTMKMPGDNPLVPVATTLGTPNTPAISVNVSGQQLLSVQMPTPIPSLNGGSLIPNTVNPILPVLTTQAGTIAATSVTDSWAASPQRTPISSATEVGTSNILSNLVGDTIGNFSDLATPIDTPSGTGDSFKEGFRDSPKMKTPEKLISEASCSSVLTTPKGLNLEQLVTSASSAKLDLSTYLSAPCFSPCPSPSPSLLSIGDCPSIPEIHIPEGVENLPLLDISMGGTVTVITNDATPGEQNFNLHKSTKVEANHPSISMSQNIELLEASKNKIMDLSLANSNSNSSFSSLLAPVVHSTIDMNESTLQTPPKRMISSPVKTDRPLFKSSLFDNQPLPSPSISEIASPVSPSRYLSQSDAQWLNNEVNDLSLSRILGQIDSPFKTPLNGLPSTLTKTDLPILPASDNSIDFRTTFAALKAQIAEEEVEGQ